MKHLVVLSRTKPQVKNCTVRDFSEQLDAYISYQKRTKLKKFATCEGFQLIYNSFYEDLKKAWYLYPGNDEVEAEIRKKLNVIEDNDYNF